MIRVARGRRAKRKPTLEMGRRSACTSVMRLAIRGWTRDFGGGIGTRWALGVRSAAGYIRLRSGARGERRVRVGRSGCASRSLPVRRCLFSHRDALIFRRGGKAGPRARGRGGLPGSVLSHRDVQGDRLAPSAWRGGDGRSGSARRGEFSHLPKRMVSSPCGPGSFPPAPGKRATERRRARDWRAVCDRAAWRKGAYALRNSMTAWR
jgi:hypothetical protein